MSQTVLLFQINVMKAAQIKSLCRSLGISAVEVPKEDYGQRLGALAGISGIRREPQSKSATTLPGEMLAFSGINSDDLDDFLDAYKAAGIPPVQRKAVITPYNIMWTPEKLYHALNQEM